MVYLLNLVVFHSYLSLPEGMSFGEDPKVGASKGKVKESHPPIHAPNQGAQNEGRVPSGKQKKLWTDPPFSMGKSTISMAIFNSYVKLPERISSGMFFQGDGSFPSRSCKIETISGTRSL